MNWQDADKKAESFLKRYGSAFILNILKTKTIKKRGGCGYYIDR